MSASRRFLCILSLAALGFCNAPNCVASVGGTIGSNPACGTGGTLYTNLTSHVMSF
jgi:hypothetical protein